MPLNKILSTGAPPRLCRTEQQPQLECAGLCFAAVVKAFHTFKFPA